MKLYRKLLFELLQSMEEAFKYAEHKSEQGQIDQNIIDIFDQIIKGFSAILDMEQAGEINLDYVNKIKFHNLLTRIIPCIHNGDLLGYQNAFSRLFEVFNELKCEIKEQNKYKIAIYGEDEDFHSLLNYDVVEVTNYYSRSEFNPGEYDYLILLEELSDEHKLIVDRSKLVNFKAHVNINIGWEFYQHYYDYFDSEKDFEGIITGLSYAEKGISTKDLGKSFFNFAGPGQDLFYDYRILQYVLEHKEQSRHLKYVIIGLAYYSFNYDMSLSTPKERANYYYPIFGTFHNYPRAEVMKKFYQNHLEVGKEILAEDYLRKYFELKKEPIHSKIAHVKNSQFNSMSLSKEQALEVKLSAQKELNKNHPITVEENKRILISILDLTVKFNLKPILLVCPTAKIYYQNLSQKTKTEFMNIIMSLDKSYKLQFLNLFDSPLFKDSDFFNPSHLNYRGAAKLSKMLNQLIKW